MLAVNFNQADETCADIMGYIVDVSGAVQFDEAGVFPYDARIFAYDWDPTEQIVTDYFTEDANLSTILDYLHDTANTKSP